MWGNRLLRSSFADVIASLRRNDDDEELRILSRAATWEALAIKSDFLARIVSSDAAVGLQDITFLCNVHRRMEIQWVLSLTFFLLWLKPEKVLELKEPSLEQERESIPLKSWELTEEIPDP